MTTESNANSVFNLTQFYQFAFDRRPDTLGEYYWNNVANNGISEVAIANSFVNGSEFQAKYGSISNAQFVQNLEANWGGHFTAAQSDAWIRALDNGTSDRGTVLYQMVDTAGVSQPSLKLAFFGDSGTARAAGHQFYYENGGATQHAIGALFRTDGAFYNVADIAELGDCAYSAGSSTTYDDAVGADYNQFMYPYPSPYYLQGLYTKTGDYINSTLNNNNADPKFNNPLSEFYTPENIAKVGNKVWPYNVYDYPNGYPNPVTGGHGGSTDSQNHFWPTPGNHDYGARSGYTDQNNTASNNDTAKPAGLTSSPTPSPYIDYFSFLRNTSLLGSQAKSINIGSVDDTGNKGIYYSVTLGDQGNGKPLVELFSIDTERLNLNAGISDEFSDGYNGDNQLYPDGKPNYKYDPSKAYNILDKNSTAQLSTDPGNGQAQFNWLKTELQNSDAKWKIIYGHHPVYSTGKMGNLLGTDHGSNPVLQNFLKNVVEQSGASFDAWINGHTHYYERVLEQNDSGIGVGIPFITNGNSGRSLYKTYQVDYGESLYNPHNIDQITYLNGLTNLLQSNPVMAGVSAELQDFVVSPALTAKGKVDPIGSTLPGTYSAGDGAIATSVGESYLLFDYVQTDTLDPAILQNLDPATRGAGLTGWDGLQARDWMPKSPSKGDTAMLEIYVGMDGSVSKVKIDNAGAGYMSAHNGSAKVDFQIRGNDSYNSDNVANPHNYAIATLIFDHGQLVDVALKSAGSGYMYAAQAVIADGISASSGTSVYSTIAPTEQLLSEYPLDLPLNISIFAGDDHIKADEQYHDWYLITDTAAHVEFTNVGGVTRGKVTVTPKSADAIEIIQTHDLTTGYSGNGPQQKFTSAQSGNVTIFDVTTQSVIKTGALNSGNFFFDLPTAAAKDMLKVIFTGDAISSYLVNFKASETTIMPVGSGAVQNGWNMDGWA